MANESPQQLSAEIRIDGMTCASCEILLERKLKVVPGILSIDINHRRGTAILIADANHLPSPQLIEKIIKETGYSCPCEASPKVSRERQKQTPSTIEPSHNK